MRVPVDQFKQVVQQVLGEVLARQQQVQVFADVLMDNELDGVHSHGVRRLDRFFEMIRQGYLKPDAQPALVHAGYCGGMNLYEYAGSGPTMAVDPSGRIWGWIIAVVVVTIVALTSSSCSSEDTCCCCVEKLKLTRSARWEKIPANVLAAMPVLEPWKNRPAMGHTLTAVADLSYKKGAESDCTMKWIEETNMPIAVGAPRNTPYDLFALPETSEQENMWENRPKPCPGPSKATILDPAALFLDYAPNAGKTRNLTFKIEVHSSPNCGCAIPVKVAKARQILAVGHDLKPVSGASTVGDLVSPD